MRINERICANKAIPLTFSSNIVTKLPFRQTATSLTLPRRRNERRKRTDGATRERKKQQQATRSTTTAVVAAAAAAAAPAAAVANERKPRAFACSSLPFAWLRRLHAALSHLFFRLLSLIAVAVAVARWPHGRQTRALSPYWSANANANASARARACKREEPTSGAISHINRRQTRPRQKLRTTFARVRAYQQRANASFVCKHGISILSLQTKLCSCMQAERYNRKQTGK